MLSTKNRETAINIFKEFQYFFKTEVQLMKECAHNYDYDNLNSYHLEDSVWTHTCLVFNTFLLTCTLADSKDVEKSVIMILCHDIGKIKTKSYNHEDKKVSFRNHGFASIQPTIDFCKYLYDKKIINDLNETLTIVLPIISNHIEYKSAKNCKKMGYINNNRIQELFMNILQYCDEYGSITDNKISKSLPYITDYTYEDQCFYDYDHTIYILSGVTGVGKDYIARSKKYISCAILSFDDIRIKLWKEEHKKDNYIWENWTEKSIYDEAFNWCNTNKIDLMKYLKEEISFFRENNKDVIISNTSLTKKSRRTLINSLGKSNYISLYVVATKETILERNKNRNSKQIPKDVINRFMNNQQVPTKQDGFSEVFIINNF